MPSPSTHLGINVFASGDSFNLNQFNSNWDVVDEVPGIFICTSTTRPGNAGGLGSNSSFPGAWGSAQAGMKIYETDTGLTWRWTGGAFIRDNPVGLLGRVTSTATVSTSDQWSPTASGTYVTALSTAVSVPATDTNNSRILRVTAEVPEVKNPTLGQTWLMLIRTLSGNVKFLNSWPVWSQQTTGSGNSGNNGTPGSFTSWDQPNSSDTAPLSVTYSLVFASQPGTTSTSTLVAGTTRPISLTIVEE